MLRMRNVVILLGSPGAGKGTQARLLRERFRIPKISTGDILRQQAQNGNGAHTLATQMNAGGLVPDDVVNRAVVERIQLADCERGFVLDGYPRNLSQARFLESQLHPPDRILAIEIQAQCEDLLFRLLSRTYCPRCGTTYTTQNDAAGVQRRCEECGGLLQKRKDDREDVIRTRFKEYEQVTGPLIAHYAASGVFHQVHGNLPVHQVFNRIEALVQQALSIPMPQTA
jgi:adenylate kinase